MVLMNILMLLCCLLADISSWMMCRYHSSDGSCTEQWYCMDLCEEDPSSCTGYSCTIHKIGLTNQGMSEWGECYTRAGMVDTTMSCEDAVGNSNPTYSPTPVSSDPGFGTGAPSPFSSSTPGSDDPTSGTGAPSSSPTGLATGAPSPGSSYPSRDNIPLSSVSSGKQISAIGIFLLGCTVGIVYIVLSLYCLGKTKTIFNEEMQSNKKNVHK